MMKLDKFFKKNYIVIICSLLILSLISFLMLQNEIKLDRLHVTHDKSLLIINELCQSSDKLTRYCRSYVMTGDIVWEKKYWQLLAIRNGTKPRSNGQFISLFARMKKMSFTKEELSKLKKAEKKSNDLVSTERKAFKVMKGLLSNKSGKFVVKKVPDKSLARHIMFDKKYHSDKRAIMKPIDESIIMLNKRIKQTINKYKKLDSWYLGGIIAIVLFLVLRSLYSYFIIKNKIVIQMDELASNEEILRGIFDNANDGIILADVLTRKFVKVNDTICQMLGYEREELLQFSTSDIHPAERFSDVIAAFDKLAESDIGQIEDMVMKRKDGRQLYANIYTSSVVLKGRRYLLGIFKDITESRQVEMKLLLANRIISMSPAVALRWKNEEGWPVEYITDNCFELFGYSAEEWLDGVIPYKSLVHPDDLLRVTEEVSKYSKNVECSKFIHKPYRIITKSGDVKWVDDRTTIICNQNGQITHYQGVILDITSSKKANQALQIAKQKADDANRAKSEFLAHMSHEIRTPMNSVLGFADILREIENDSQKSGYIDNIRTSGKSLLKLINNVLDLAKVEAGKMELQHTLTSLRSLSAEMKVIFSHKMVEKELEFEFAVEDNVPQSVILDECRLRQVFINLLGNAVKFTHDGFVKLRTSCQFSKGSNEKMVDLLFVISDSGIGVPSDQHKSMFASFGQVKEHKSNKYGGTGLGLAITHRIIKLMGGTISVESEVDSGTIFTIAIPNVEIATGVTFLQEAINTEKVSFVPADVLIVDDVDYDREMLEIYLSNLGLTAHTAKNGREGIELARSIDPDLILLDMQMPVMDGYEAAEILKSDDETKNIPLISVTASVFNSALGEVKNICDGYMLKPVSKEDFIIELMNFLPFNIVEKPFPSNIEDLVNPISIKSLELRKILERDYLATCLKLQKNNDLAEISLFAKSLITLSEAYKENELNYFANALFLNATQVFDIDRIATLLEQFVKTASLVEQV